MYACLDFVLPTLKLLDANVFYTAEIVNKNSNIRLL